MEALADAICLWAPGLGPGVIDIFDRQVEFVFVPLWVTTIFGAAIGEHPAEPKIVIIEEWDHAIIQQFGGGYWSLTFIELGKRHLGIGVNEGLLIDPADTLQSSDIESVLRTAIAWTFTIKFAVRLLLSLGTFQGLDLCFGQQQALLR